jgi:hypothetical protein
MFNVQVIGVINCETVRDCEIYFSFQHMRVIHFYRKLPWFILVHFYLLADYVTNFYNGLVACLFY